MGFRLSFAVLLFALSVAIAASGFAATSPSGSFNVTPDSLVLNWTNGTINITANANNLTLIVAKGSNQTEIYSQYFTGSEWGSLAGPFPYPSLDTTIYKLCFEETSGDKRTMEFIVQNQTGSYTNTTGQLDSTNSTLMYIIPYLQCPPGKYSGNFTVWNSTNSTLERVNISAVVNIPISENNTFNSSTNYAFLRGVNASSGPHSYYIWTNISSNSTWATLMLSGLTGDADVFLLNSSGLIGKSINNGTLDEEMVVPISGNQLWEIRIYGNTTSNYNSSIYLTPLNITNATNPAQALRSVNFGTLDPNGSSSINLNLSNTDDMVLSGLTQYTEIWHTDSWLNNNAAASFALVVPNFTQKIKVRLEWTNTSGRWNVSISDPSGNRTNSSSNKWYNANTSNMGMEEFIVFEGTFNRTNEGLWTISVANITNATTYNLTVYTYFNASQWFSTDFPSSFTLNSSGLTNSSRNVTINLTVPQKNVLNGSYEGFFQWNSTGYKARLPFSFDVKAGVLLINGNLSNSTYSITDNIGFNKTITANISFNNTGAYPIYYTNTSTGALYLTTNTSRYINFTVGDWPSNPIGNGASGTINITYTVNTTITQNEAGTYRGWILFNTTNSTINSSAYPYDIYNLTVDVALSSGLNVTVLSVSPTPVPYNTSSNVTVAISVRYQNGTPVNDVNFNYTRFWMNESNVSQYGYDLTKPIQAWPGGVCDGSISCFSNVSTPSSMIGGRYKIYSQVIWTAPSGSNLTGTGTDGNLLVVNASGIYLVGGTLSSTSATGVTDVYYNVTAYNYGPIEAAGALNLTSNCSSVVTISSDGGSGTNCASTSGGSSFTVAITGNGTEYCWYRWRITTTNTTTSCLFTAAYSPSNNAFNTLTSATLQLSAPTTSTPGTTGGGAAAPGVAYTPSLSILSATSPPSLYLGNSSTGTVVVKNNGSISANVFMNVGIDGGFSTSASPATCLISVGNNCTFTVNFTALGNATLGNHTGTYRAQVVNGTIVSNVKNFAIEVLATAQRVQELNTTYMNYTAVYESLGAQLQTLKASGIPASNLSRSEILLNESNSTLAQAKAAINASNWALAESLLRDLNSSLTRLQTELSNITVAQQQQQEAFQSSLWVWAIVAVVAVAVVAFAAYLLLPSKTRGGWHPTKGYLPHREAPHHKIHHHLKKIKEKVVSGEGVGGAS